MRFTQKEKVSRRSQNERDAGLMKGTAASHPHSEGSVAFDD
jgi:hypothetical protein